MLTANQKKNASALFGKKIESGVVAKAVSASLKDVLDYRKEWSKKNAKSLSKPFSDVPASITVTESPVVTNVPQKASLTPSDEVREFFAKRDSFITQPVSAPSKEALRQKLLNTPLRNNIRLYAAAIHVHGMDTADLMKVFGLQKSSARSIQWQVKTDLALNKVL